MPGCPGATGPALTRCTASVPSGLEGWIEVRTRTETTGGQTLLPPRFARSLAGNGAYAGTDVRAAPSGVGDADLRHPRSTGDDLAVRVEPDDEQRGELRTGAAVLDGLPDRLRARDLPAQHHGCHQLPGRTVGFGPPGGFGWLESSACSATVSATGWVDDDPGVSMPNPCRSVIANIVGSGGGLIMMPIYVETNGLNGSTGRCRTTASPPSTSPATPCPASGRTRSPPVDASARLGSTASGWFTRPSSRGVPHRVVVFGGHPPRRPVVDLIGLPRPPPDAGHASNEGAHAR